MDAPGFQPADSAQLLSDLCSDSLSFEQVAHLHGTTVTHLAAWMSRPHVAAQLDALRAAALTRARLIALQKLPAISRALTTMVVDFSERRSPAFADAADPDRRATLIARDRDAARRACWLLYRLALLTDPGTPPPRPARRPPDNSPPPTNEHPSSTPTPRTSIEHLAPLPSSLAVPAGASASAASKAAVCRAPTIAASEHVCNATTPAAPRHRVTITSSITPISPPLIPTAHTPRAPASPTPRTLIDTTGRARAPPPRPTHSANAAAARIDTFVLTATPPGVTLPTAYPAQGEPGTAFAPVLDQQGRSSRGATMSQWSIEVTQPIGEHASGEEAIESTSSRPKDLGAVQECAGSAIEKTSMSAWTTRKVRVSDVYEGTHA